MVQVWRPTSLSSTDPVSTYTLVSQTFVRPTQLRDVDVHLDPDQYIRMRRGDVLGFYHPRFNPVGWSAVPCAAVDRQAYRVALPSTAAPADVGRTVHFQPASVDEPAPCRHYSFAAVFGKSTSGCLHRFPIPLKASCLGLFVRAFKIVSTICYKPIPCSIKQSNSLI